MNHRIDPSPLSIWQSHLERGELAYQVTEDGRAVFFPRVTAPGTGGPLAWRVSRGLGTVYATTVNHLRDEPPRHVALIDLDEGFRMMSRVDGIAPDAVRIGLRVKLQVLPAEEGRAPLPVFVPVGESAA